MLGIMVMILFSLSSSIGLPLCPPPCQTICFDMILCLPLERGKRQRLGLSHPLTGPVESRSGPQGSLLKGAPYRWATPSYGLLKRCIPYFLRAPRGPLVTTLATPSSRRSCPLTLRYNIFPHLLPTEATSANRPPPLRSDTPLVWEDGRTRSPYHGDKTALSTIQTFVKMCKSKLPLPLSLFPLLFVNCQII